MTSYPIPCPHCYRVVDSMDSMADSRSELEHHILVRHGDLPDASHDPRFANL